MKNLITDDKHRRRTQRRKVVVDERMAWAAEDRGVLVVLSGPGKGKSSSAFGMVARALGQGLSVGIGQFIKGRYATGEAQFFRCIEAVDYHVMGEGCTWETQDRDWDIAAAEAAWDRAAAMLVDPSYGLVVLDELNIVLKYVKHAFQGGVRAQKGIEL